MGNNINIYNSYNSKVASPKDILKKSMLSPSIYTAESNDNYVFRTHGLSVDSLSYNGLCTCNTFVHVLH